MQDVPELTIELTDWCPHDCPYCSFDSTRHWNDATFISTRNVSDLLEEAQYNRINLSGGEPISHPSFYEILERCKEHVSNMNGMVWVYTNAIPGIMYNAGVVEGVRVHANLTVPDDTDAIHILKRIKQGREGRRPGITFSRNWSTSCHPTAETCPENCEHHYVRPNGTVVKGPCRKYEVKHMTSQNRETLDKAGATIHKRISPTEVVLKVDDKLELWVENDDFAGYVIEIDGKGYEFVRGV